MLKKLDRIFMLIGMMLLAIVSLTNIIIGMIRIINM